MWQCPGIGSTRAAAQGSSHYSCATAASATTRCKMSAVSEDECLGNYVSLRDCPSAVGNRWVPLWFVFL
jgi:hypothetical protein